MKRRLGNYLGRPVYILDWSDPSFATESLRHAVVLVWLRPDTSTPVALSHLSVALVAKEPLAVAIAGDHAEDLFLALLQQLSLRGPDPVVMTRHLERAHPEVVEDFFSATWPAEERFDDWQSYVVLTFASETSLEEAILAFIDVTEGSDR